MILALVESMDDILGNIPIASTAEAIEVLENWNRTEAPEYISEDLIFSQFRKVAKTCPDSVALVIQDEQVTFRELDRRSDLLCSYLLSLGVTSESMVAVCLYRSIELIVALVGIVKCGAAYVPIDPTYPEARQIYILNNSKAGVLLTTRDSQFSESVPSLILSEHWGHIEEAGEGHLDVSVVASASNSMYVIYTSGSTGNPKGVVLQHRGLTNRLLTMAKLLEKEEKRKRDHDSDFVEDVGVPSAGCPEVNLTSAWVDHRILQKTSVCFDVSVWELFLSLITGCCMVLLEPQQEKDPQAIVEAIDRHSVTMLHFVPTMLGVFVASGQESIREKCTSLDFVVTSGEALDVTSASTIQVCFPALLLVLLISKIEPCSELESGQLLWSDRSHYRCLRSYL
jgi:non-ribosomal peptide synthetase component F